MSNKHRVALASAPDDFEKVSVSVELNECEWHAVRLLSRACALPVPSVFRAFAHAASMQFNAGGVNSGGRDVLSTAINVIDFMLAFDDCEPGTVFPGVSFGGADANKGRRKGNANNSGVSLPGGDELTNNA